MGFCKYCRRDGTFIFDFHVGCAINFLKGKKELHNYLLNIFKNYGSFNYNDIQNICRNYCIDNDSLNVIYVDVFTDAVEYYLHDHLIDDRERNILNDYVQFVRLPRNILNRYGAADNVLNANILNAIINRHIIPDLNLPIGSFLLSSNEKPLFVFNKVTFMEEYIDKRYVGTSGGVSVRLCKGVYGRFGGYQGRRIENKSMKKTSTGSVCLTDKNLYYVSTQKSIKIPYSKILNLVPYSDGILIQQDGNRAKPVAFYNLDSWVTMNLISNLKS